MHPSFTTNRRCHRLEDRCRGRERERPHAGGDGGGALGWFHARQLSQTSPGNVSHPHYASMITAQVKVLGCCDWWIGFGFGDGMVPIESMGSRYIYPT